MQKRKGIAGYGIKQLQYKVTSRFSPQYPDGRLVVPGVSSRELAQTGKKLFTAFEKSQSDNAKTLRETGQLARPLHDDIEERSHKYAGWLVGAMHRKRTETTAEVKELQTTYNKTQETKDVPTYRNFSKEMLDYDIVSLIKYLPSPDDRNYVLEDLIIECIRQENEKLLRRAIAVGLDHKINGPVEDILPYLTATGHLQFLHNKKAESGMHTPEDHRALLKHFGDLEAKVAHLKPAGQKKMLKAIAAIHPDKKEATRLTEQAAGIVVHRKRSKRQPKDNPARAQELLRPYIDKPPYRPRWNENFDLEVLVNFALIEREVTQFHDSGLRSSLYETMSTLHPKAHMRLNYFLKSGIVIEDIKDEAKRAERYKELRDKAYKPDLRRDLHRLFTENATLEALMIDGGDLKTRRDELNGSGDQQSYDAQNDLVQITKDEITRRKPFNITQQRVYDRRKDGMGIV